MNAKGWGPRATLKVFNLESKSAEEKAVWVAEARLSVIVGASADSKESLKSGLRCYEAFIGARSCVRVGLYV